jgi:ubiquinone/menaquinone biosynthesis C-methylase UbiE
MGTDALVTQRQLNLHIAEQIAPGWERRRPEIEAAATPVRRWMVQALASRPGDTVLELAAGMGDTGYEVARRLGEHGHLITSDFSAAMLAGARRRGAELGIDNAEYRQLDAEHLDLDDDSVDAVLCRFAFMLMPDPGTALSEARRVLRQGGRLVLAVWAAPERNPFFTAIVGALVRHGYLPPPPPDAPGVFALADETRLRAALRAGGFSHVETDEIPSVFSVSTMGAYIGLVADTAGPIGLTIQALPEDAREALGRECETMLEPFAVDTGYDIPSLALCAVAR